jgi:hypothetical protein
MEQPSTSSSPAPAPPPRRSPKVRLRRQRLESLLQELQRTLDGLGDADLGASLSEVAADSEAPEYGDSEEADEGDSAASLASDSDSATDQVWMRRGSGLRESYEALIALIGV